MVKPENARNSIWLMMEIPTQSAFCNNVTNFVEPFNKVQYLRQKYEWQKGFCRQGFQLKQISVLSVRLQLQSPYISGFTM